nr:MAG TPA: hypothetical protein [Caudoviricetes sp.]
MSHMSCCVVLITAPHRSDAQHTPATFPQYQAKKSL